MKNNHRIKFVFLMCALILALVMVGCETAEERQLREFQEQMDENFADILGMEVDEFSALREEQQKNIESNLSDVFSILEEPTTVSTESKNTAATIPEFVDLNLPIMMQEITFDTYNHLRILQSGELQERISTGWWSGEWVTKDTNVRSLEHHGGSL